MGEYLKALAQGALQPGHAGWLLPGGLRAVLQGRLAAVAESSRLSLHIAAVIGRSFDFDTLREASGQGEEETVIALEELMARGIVLEVTSSSHQLITYDFSHEKIRVLVYDEISRARRRLLHRRVAEAMEQRAHVHRDGSAAAAQIAHHYRQAGQPAEATEWFRLAGEHARSVFANVEALIHFQLARDVQSETDGAATADLHEGIADLLMLAGEYGEALPSYAAAAALVDPSSRTRIAHKVGNVYVRRGAWAEAQAHFASALAMLEPTDSAARARLLADQSLVAHHRGQTAQAAQYAQESLQLAEAAGDLLALAQTHNILSILASSRHNVAVARHHAERALALAEALGDGGARAATLNNLAGF